MLSTTTLSISDQNVTFCFQDLFTKDICILGVTVALFLWNVFQSWQGAFLGIGITDGGGLFGFSLLERSQICDVDRYPIPSTAEALGGHHT